MRRIPTAGGKEIPWIDVHSEQAAIAPDVCYEVASILIEWSRFENGIVADTSQFMRYKNIQALTDDAPRNFKGKIELWKKCIKTIFPTVSLYKERATEICSKGKIVSRHRNHLIHGIWSSCENDENVYIVRSLKALQFVEEMNEMRVDIEYLKLIHQDIRTVTDALFEFMANRMWHGSLGLLKVHPSP